MRKLTCLLLALACPMAANASCIDTSDAEAIAAAQVVFIATITEARLATPVAELRDGRKSRETYRIDYAVEVRETLRGDPLATKLFSRHHYRDYKRSRWPRAEDGHFHVGENIAVIAGKPGDVQLSLCGASQSLDNTPPGHDDLLGELDKLREGRSGRARPRITAEQFTLGGIAIGDSEASVRARLGEPASTRDTGEGWELHYDGLIVWVGYPGEDHGSYASRDVYEILSTDARYCTPAMVCPGADIAVATNAYGPTLPTEREDGITLEYVPAGESCWLQILPEQGRIASLRVECQP